MRMFHGLAGSLMDVKGCKGDSRGSAFRCLGCTSPEGSTEQKYI